MAIFPEILAPELITGHVAEFKDCLLAEESTTLESALTKPKLYAPGVGLLRDQVGNAAAAKK
jgi:hypothetical protein